MKQILVISGKGGTGKTVITASFAVLAGNSSRDGSSFNTTVMADCDVDAADLYLLLHPKNTIRSDFKSGKTAKINQELCNNCGKCREACRFSAISSDFVVDPIACEGCTICSYVCPVDAISLEDNMSGDFFISETEYGKMVHAKLGIAEENSGKLVSLVRTEAKKIADQQNSEYVIVDGPPGIGCPVIAALSNIDLAVIVTEPTLSGIHDMKRVMKVATHFGVKTVVCVNKYDLNRDNTNEIERICKEEGVLVIGKIVFDKIVPESLVQCMPIVQYSDGEVSQQIKEVWEQIKVIVK